MALILAGCGGKAEPAPESERPLVQALQEMRPAFLCLDAAFGGSERITDDALNAGAERCLVVAGLVKEQARTARLLKSPDDFKMLVYLDWLLQLRGVGPPDPARMDDVAGYLTCTMRATERALGREGHETKFARRVSAQTARIEAEHKRSCGRHRFDYYNKSDVDRALLDDKTRNTMIFASTVAGHGMAFLLYRKDAELAAFIFGRAEGVEFPRFPLKAPPASMPIP